jgi:hypothetical protein
MALEYGSVPQWVTALIAATAGYLAFRSIQSQRSIARRRAAFDLFLKTETDEKMITAYEPRYNASLAKLRENKMDQEAIASLSGFSGLLCHAVSRSPPMVIAAPPNSVMNSRRCMCHSQSQETELYRYKRVL